MAIIVIIIVIPDNYCLDLVRAPDSFLKQFVMLKSFNSPDNYVYTYVRCHCTIMDPRYTLLLISKSSCKTQVGILCAFHLMPDGLVVVGCRVL